MLVVCENTHLDKNVQIMPKKMPHSITKRLQSRIIQ